MSVSQHGLMDELWSPACDANWGEEQAKSGRGGPTLDGSWLGSRRIRLSISLASFSELARWVSTLWTLSSQRLSPSRRPLNLCSHGCYFHHDCTTKVCTKQTSCLLRSCWWSWRSWMRIPRLPATRVPLVRCCDSSSQMFDFPLTSLALNANYSPSSCDAWLISWAPRDVEKESIWAIFWTGGSCYFGAAATA